MVGNIRLRLFAPAGLAAFGMLLFGGCAPEQPKMPTFKKGGHIRVVNLASTPISAWIGGQQAAVNLEQGKHGGLRLTSLKEKDIKVDAAGETVFTGKLLVESDKLYTVAAFDKGKGVAAAIVTGEPKVGPDGAASLVVVNLTGGSDFVAAEVAAGARSLAFDSVGPGAASPAQTVPPGPIRWTVKAGNRSATGSGEVAQGEGNTLFVFSSRRGLKALLFSNKPKILLGGASGGTPMN